MLEQINFAYLYDALFGEQTQDLNFYKYFIEKNNGPTLEIGSGTGRLLLPYLKDKLSVEGIEPDNSMREFCIHKAKELEISPIIYPQFLQNMKIAKKYNLIYMPLYVFQHITKREEAFESLKRVRNHIVEGGQLLLSIFMPWNDPTATWENNWRISKIAQKNAFTIALSESINFDNFNQIETKFLKYELFQDNVLDKTYFSTIEFRTYSRFELTIMLENTGFKNIEIFGDYTLDKAYNESQAFVFSAQA